MDENYQTKEEQKANDDIIDINAVNAIDTAPQKEAAVSLNPDYYDEFGRPKYEEITNYMNELRAEIEQSSPLISDKMDIHYLEQEFKDSGFETSIKTIVDKYKFIRTTRRDGNCFYRSFMFRIFEELAMNKNKGLFDQIVKVVEESKGIAEKHGYEWITFEDFYNSFLSEWKFVYQLDPLNTIEYIKLLFADKEKCSYMITYIRFFISSYIRENRALYECFIFDEDLDNWCFREVDAVDNECDQIQIMAVVNAFNIGVVIESLTMTGIDTIKFPEDANNIFIHLLFRPGHYDILYLS